MTETIALQPSRIATTFEALRAESKTAIMPFVTAGFPHMDTSEKIVLALAEAGANGFEIGIPYSDPLADGPTVQRSSQVSLENGTKLVDCIDLVRRVRAAGVSVPMVLMGYYNPLVRYGIDRFVADSAAAGVDGFIIPDLPVEECDVLQTACQKYQRDLVFMVAPTSTDSVLDGVAAHASGFIYCVSVTGVTGARDTMSKSLPEYLEHVRSKTNLPLIVGFGVSKPEHITEIGQHADGAIIASALMNYLNAFPESDQPAQAAHYLCYMRGDVDL
ncbi:MAG: tryptophan synthase subunit alpha [Thermomicrobiales bacterium]